MGTPRPKQKGGKPEAPAAATPAVPLLTRAVLLIRSLALLLLLGAFAPASQLNLSPVYGSIPAAQWHTHVLAAGLIVGWSAGRGWALFAPRPRPARLLPLTALSVPLLQCTLFRYSALLGPRLGPLITELLTLFPLAALTGASVADHAKDVVLPLLGPHLTPGQDEAGLISRLTPRPRSVVLPALAWAVVQRARALCAAHVAARAGLAFHYTRVGMELCLGAAWAALAPSAYLLLALPALLHAALVNPHVATFTGNTALNGTLRDEGWMLLDRRESVTGYISVTQNMADMARVMRADHSLLGGDWVDFRGPIVTEPVYSVFVMLEAVRLIDRREPLPDADATALVIGLGIGTVPSALVAHGIDTTVVEIDPAVYDFAKKYFRLRESRPAVIEDAVAYTDRLARQGATTFDYIIHDVFTGGAEPVDLFTLEFFQNLASLLNDDGVIAVNYAGDLALPTPKIILQTIQAVFPICRIFRESPRDEASFARTGTDFTNLIFFCRKIPASAPSDPDSNLSSLSLADTGPSPSSPALTFRAPIDQDRLKSRARYAYLVPQIEVLPADFLADLAPSRPQPGAPDNSDFGVLTKANTWRVQEWHRKSATGHWMIMRSVLKSSFWENW